jgi:3-deoxy-D-manno-octulosonate 8-phosphate phosphatase KdsC-like HAD superfamily phosphatase
VSLLQLRISDVYSGRKYKLERAAFIVWQLPLEIAHVVLPCNECIDCDALLSLGLSDQIFIAVSSQTCQKN